MKRNIDFYRKKANAFYPGTYDTCYEYKEFFVFSNSKSVEEIPPIAVDKRSGEARAFNPLNEGVKPSEGIKLNENGELAHAFGFFRKKGEERKEHKYYTRVEYKKNKYRYFYDRESYMDYLRGKQKKEQVIQKISDAKNKITTTANKAASIPANAAKKVADAIVTQAKYELYHELDLPKTSMNPKSVPSKVDRAKVNPDYDPKNPKTSMNCGYCTLAYDMRRRGYDVEAIQTDVPTSIYYRASLYDPPADVYSLDPEKNPELPPLWAAPEEYANAIKTAMLKTCGDTENARGDFRVEWYGGGGHSMAWERRGNDIRIIDCQTNKEYAMEEILAYSVNMGYYRSDNTNPSKRLMKKVQPARNLTDTKWKEKHRNDKRRT